MIKKFSFPFFKLKRSFTSLLALLFATLFFCGCQSKKNPEMPQGDNAKNYTALTDKDFLTAADTLLKNAEGTTVQLKGTNFGGWLHMEGWMDGGGDGYNHFAVRDALGKRFNEEQTESLLDVYQNSFITEQDVENVAELGLNMIRVPFFWAEIMTDNGEILGNAFERLDWLVKTCKARGIYVLLDLHGAPGGHSAGWVTGGHTGSNELWTNEEYQRRTVKIWQALAEHYKDEPAICGYGLLNEPVPPENSPLTRAQLYDMIYDAVREKDERHTIVLGAFYSFDDLGSPAENGWTNVVYETHHYDADNKKSAEMQQAFAAGQLGYIQSYQAKWNVPVLAGEFNFWSAKDAWLTWLHTLNSMGVSWSNWTYKHTDQDAQNNWGLYYQPTVETVDYEKDGYEEIARKWRGYTTENYRRNTFLTDIFAEATTSETLRGECLSTDTFTVTAYRADVENAVENLIDGNRMTRWSNGEKQSASGRQWLEIDFSSTCSFDCIDLYTPTPDYTRGYKIYAWIENEWRVIARGEGKIGYTTAAFERVETDKIRIEQTENSAGQYWSIYEISIRSFAS